MIHMRLLKMRKCVPNYVCTWDARSVKRQSNVTNTLLKHEKDIPNHCINVEKKIVTIFM